MSLGYMLLIFGLIIVIVIVVLVGVAMFSILMNDDDAPHGPYMRTLRKRRP